MAAPPQATDVSRTGRGRGSIRSGKGSGLVRYPNTSNALRALLNDPDAQAVPVSPNAMPGRLATPGRQPLMSGRSRPSPEAMRLVESMGLNPGRIHPESGPSNRPPPRPERPGVREAAELGDMIRIRRQMLKLSQKDLAERTGLSVQALQMASYGVRPRRVLRRRAKL